jgi:hydrogenase maturation protease
MILLIGYGNDLRRDDGAGLILAERLEQIWQSDRLEVKRLSVHQLTPELALEIARPEVTAVVFADARAAIASETQPELQAALIHPESSSPSLGHHLDPAALITYARLLYGQQPPAWVVTVPGVDFGYGEGLSEITEKSIAKGNALANELLEHLQVI